MKKILTLLFAATITSMGVAQSSDLGNWLVYLGNKKINNRWNIHHEAQYRNYNAIGDLEQLLLRTGVGYNLTENNNNVLLGYGFIHSQNYVAEGEKVGNNEHRIFQQFITRQNIGRVAIQHRYRYEQRWIENAPFRQRFRYSLSLNIPINTTSMNDKSVVYFSTYNEIFLNDRGNIFDRNRLYGGMGYRVNQLVGFEIGYMNQFLNNNGRDQINLITFINF